MTNQVIPAEAIEAAAIALHDREQYLELFSDAPDYRRERFLEIAHLALEAAVPHMLAPDAASVWDEAATVLYLGNSINANQARAMYQRNPYRPAVAESNRQHLEQFRDWKPGDLVE